MAPSQKRKIVDDDFIHTISDNEEPDVVEEELSAAPPSKKAKTSAVAVSKKEKKKRKNNKKNKSKSVAADEDEDNEDVEEEEEPTGIWGVNDEDDGAMDSEFEFVFAAGGCGDEDEEMEDVDGKEEDDEEGDESDNESVATQVDHPDDKDSGSEDEEEDAEEEAKRRDFFAAPEETENTGKKGDTSSFQGMSLSRPILRGLTSVGFTKPTPIQAKTIPIALMGKDVVGGAVTGSGKTAAFVVPILERLLYRPKKVPTTRVVILTPTRELAIQCHAVAVKLAGHTDIKFCLAVGGLSVKVQEAELRLRPDVVIATPGRFIDHMRNSASFAVETVEILVLDEADRMLEDGFADELNEILTTIPKSRQTMLFSATMTSSVDKLVRVGMNKPARIMVDSQKKTANNLAQEFVRLRPGREEKREGYLVHICKTLYTERVIIFFRQKKIAHRMRIIFGLFGLSSAELHGSMNQAQRIASVEDFRDGKVNFLLATDLASRGLDIKGVDTVINYEAPQTVEIYVHRVGRTARAGRSGVAITLAAEPDRKVVKAAVRSGKAQGAKIISRIIDAADADKWQDQIDEMDDEIDEVLREEKEEKQLAQVEMQVKKGENMIRYEEEINARPKRTWFETQQDKRDAKEAGRAELNGVREAMKKKGAGKLSNKDRKKLDSKAERGAEGKGWKKGKAERDGKGAVLNLKKVKKPKAKGPPRRKGKSGRRFLFGKERENLKREVGDSGTGAAVEAAHGRRKMQGGYGYGQGYGAYGTGSGSGTPPLERGARRKKLAAVAGSVYRAGVAAASELKEQYNNTRIRGVETGSQVSIPGAFPQVSIITKGDEQMVLFPTYAKKHVKENEGGSRFPPGHPGQAASATRVDGSEEQYWKEEWARVEDEKAVVDVDVRGWIYMPSKGPMTRRNRMVLGLARRLSGIPPPLAQADPTATSHDRYEEMKEEQRIAKEAREIEKRGQDEKEVANRGGYSEAPSGFKGENHAPVSPPSSPTLSARTNTVSQTDMTEAELSVANANLMARLGPFMTTPLVQIPITIFFYNHQQSRSHTVLTDDSGHFSARVALEFVPTDIRVLANENISTTKPVELIDSKGVSLISDVDDTVKRSNIWMGAREIFRNTFVRDLGDLTIDGVKEWYHRMQELGVKMHYCSNSPWQLFPVLATFFHTAGLPQGSIHLKQYSGMLQGIFEPVAERKKGTLEAIIRDFPERKFILVGDSGEADLEVYTELAVANPGRILAVFIRDVTTPDQAGFFDSSFNLNSAQSSRPGSTRAGIENRPAIEKGENKPQPPPRAPAPPPKTGPVMGTLIDFDEEPALPTPSSQSGSKPGTPASDSSSRKPPPPRPAKPMALRSRPSDASLNTHRSLPTGLDARQSLLQRTQTSASAIPNTNKPTPPPPPPPRRSGTAPVMQRQQQTQHNNANSNLDIPDLELPRGSGSSPTGLSGMAAEAIPPPFNGAATAATTAVNKKVDMWLRRLARAHEILDANGVKLYTWRKGDDVIAEAEGIVREALREMGVGRRTIFPKSLFPDTVACPVKNLRLDKKTGGACHFFLLPAPDPSPNTRHPAITVLPPPNSMHAYVEVASAPTADTPGACVFLHFDNRRYLFGRMAEGTQRNLVQRKISMAKFHDIFLSGRIDWEATGGLLGMILTVADIKASSSAHIKEANIKRRDSKLREVKEIVSHFNIHGGKNLVHMLATARRFILRKAMPLNPRELRHDPRPAHGRSEPDYKDENIMVWSIPVTCTPPEVSPTDRPLKRKRSWPNHVEDGGPVDSLAREDANQDIRESVVKDMFGSSWNLDTLREMNIKDVEMPAKLFVRNAQGHIESYSGPNPDSADCPNVKVLVRLPWPAAKVESLPPTDPSTQTMCYIVRSHPRRGKFDPAAAVRLGVQKKDYKKLTSGESVQGKDGIVTPDMVIGATIDGHGFAIIDIPFAYAVDEVLSRHEWTNSEIMKGIDVMYWILSQGATFEDPRIQQFMKDRPSIKHVLLASPVCPNELALESPAAQLIQMNQIDPERFHLPIFDINPRSPLDKELESVAEIGRPGHQFGIAPKVGFVADSVAPVMDTAKPGMELATQFPQVLQMAAAARESVSDPAFLAEVEQSQQDLPCPDAEIIPLGTGSAMPSKYRNVSATLIRIPGWGNLILDCGENTLGQLHRCFGHAATDAILRDLRAIYISHAHADHHLGTISIIARWRELLPSLPADRKLAIIATQKYQHFLREFQSVQHLAPARLVPVTMHGADYSRPRPGTLGVPSFPPTSPPRLGEFKQAAKFLPALRALLEGGEKEEE
ncbi:nucleolar DEAD-box protein required for synthesis of 60S ribosomal subunit [Collariella sp. IMI 366227]|nr:nucleolar DEAD-box protein required for synthesis of 60S ribosomal subunit [Collariella sp. IMI 366227]